MGISSGISTDAPTALAPPIHHKTVLQFSDISDDDQLYSVLASAELQHGDPHWPDHDSDLEDEVESSFEVVTDVEATVGDRYLRQRSCNIDLQPATLGALARLRAPTLAELDPDGASKLHEVLEGASTPAYRVCRQHGVWERLFLQASRPIARGEAIGVLVGRLVETDRWKAEKRGPTPLSLSLRRWDIPSRQLRALSKGQHEYRGGDLTVDLEAAANELVHLQDPFWEQEGYGGEEANAELVCMLIFDRKWGIAVPTVVLKARRAIKPADTLTVSLKDEFWVEMSVRENMKAAATAWASLHLPLLRLRDLARRHGVPVAFTAPYYPEELQEWKKMKEREARHLATSSVALAAAGADTSYLAAVVASEGSRLRRQERRFNRMYIDDDGSWFLHDGNESRLLVEGPPPCSPPTSLPPTDEAFRPVNDAELKQLPYTTQSNYEHVPEAVRGQLCEGKKGMRSLPTSERSLIDSGLCPKLEVHEVIALHHPVRFLTRPDLKAYGAHVRPGAAVRPGEAVGVYVGEVFLQKDYEEDNDNVDEQMYVYSLQGADVAECFGHSRRSQTAVRFPTLMVDAGKAGNVTRFINDVYARSGQPQPTVEAEVIVDSRTGLPHMMVRWAAKAAVGRGWDELTVDYGSTGYWKVGGRALHRQLKAHAEVASIARERLKAALRERGVDERVIAAAAAPVDISRETWYARELDDDDDALDFD